MLQQRWTVYWQEVTSEVSTTADAALRISKATDSPEKLLVY
jgi:hypothetical protein